MAKTYFSPKVELKTLTTQDIVLASDDNFVTFDSWGSGGKEL